jgi:hypothetical protein
MADRERRLRAEVLLLVTLAESQEDWTGFRVAPDGGFEEMQTFGGGGVSDEQRASFEGAFGAAVAAKLLPEGQAEWLRGLADRFEEPPAPPQLSPEQRAKLDRLLQRLAEDTVAEGRSGRVGHALVRFHEAVRAAHSLGALDADDLVDWDRRIDVLHGLESSAGDVAEETRSEPLVGFKAVLPGPQGSNGMQVISVECYDGGLVVRSRTSHAIEGDVREADFRALDVDVDVAVTDDAGVEYEGGGGGGGSGTDGGFLVSTWTWTFTPGVSPATRTLIVHLGDQRFEFDATGVAERPAV